LGNSLGKIDIEFGMMFKYYVISDLEEEVEVGPQLVFQE
jgi:hypothetical protein